VICACSQKKQKKLFNDFFSFFQTVTASILPTRSAGIATSTAPLKIVLSDLHAQIPVRGSPNSAGLDLRSVKNFDIKPMSRGLISTGLRMEIAQGYAGMIQSRSSLALKENVTAFHGLIDRDYRGILEVLLYNSNKDKTFKIRIGDRIAQIVLYRIWEGEMECVQFRDLSVTERGSGGFGSSDAKLDAHKFINTNLERLSLNDSKT
jgi:dUTP pyrophosphatase